MEPKWTTLTYQQIEQLQDPKQRGEYYKQMRQTMTWINPLYMYALKHGFDDTEFQKQETIQGMITELKKFYDTNHISNEERIRIGLHQK